MMKPILPSAGYFPPALQPIIFNNLSNHEMWNNDDNIDDNDRLQTLPKIKGPTRPEDQL